MELDKWSYLAGILDGEGHIAVQRAGFKGKNARYRFTIDVKMTDRIIVEWLAENFGGMIAFCPSKNPRWRDQWRWRKTGGPARELYAQVRPLLKIKNNIDMYRYIPR